MRAVRRMSKVAERVGLVSLQERPGDFTPRDPLGYIQ